MKGFDIHGNLRCDRIAVIAECSAGNESVGDMWQEVMTFDKNTTLEHVLNWCGMIGCSGKIIIRPDLATEKTA